MVKEGNLNFAEHIKYCFIMVNWWFELVVWDSREY